MRLVDRADCMCGRGKERAMLPWYARWGFLTSLFQDDGKITTPSNQCVMKRNRSLFWPATEPINVVPSKKNNDAVCGPTQEAHFAPSIPMLSLERTGTLIMIAPNSVEIREELQRFAQSQQDAADTRYHLEVMQRMEQLNNCLTDSCVS